MKFLFLTDWTYPCDHPILQGVYADRLVDRGYEIVWVMRPNGKQDEIIEEAWDNNPVYILPSRAYSPVKTSISSIIRSLENHPLNEIIEQHSDVDFIQTRNDLSMGIIALHLADIYNIPYIHRVSHTKAETLMYEARHGYAPKRDYLKARLGKRLRERICSRADLVLSISDTMTGYLKQTCSTPIESIPTGANERLQPENIDPTQFYEAHDVEPYTQMIVYIGAMSGSRQLEFLLDSFKKVRERKEAQLVMVGGRNQRDLQRLANYADELGISEDLTLTGWISNNKIINQSIVAADVAVSPIPSQLISFRTSSPLKVHEYLNLETPVVGTNIPDQSFVIKKSNGGYIVPYDTNEFANSIVKLLESQKTRKIMGKNGRKFINQCRSYSALADRLSEIYKKE